jgi:mRNA interferase MazF
MGRFVKGDIVVLPFPFSDLSGSKRRPAVVLANLTGDDLILSQITSKNIDDKYSVALATDDIDGGSLAQAGNIRPNKLFTAEESLILYKVGALKPEKLKATINKVVEIFTS